MTAEVGPTHGMRFYAGYPLEDPDGHRTRLFSDHDASALQNLGLTIQEHVFGIKARTAWP